MLQILGGDRNVFFAHSAAGLCSPDKASIMHTYSHDTVYLTVWKYKFGAAFRFHLSQSYKQDPAVAVGRDSEVRQSVSCHGPVCGESYFPAGYLKLHI